MTDSSHFFELARALQSVWHLPGSAGREKGKRETLIMNAIEFASNKAFAAVFAFAVSAVCMAAAIVPASPAGLIA